MLFSPVLRIAGRTSVNVLSNLFGIPGEIYFPKGYTDGRAGYDDEIEYSDTPDWEGKLLAPFVFNTAKQHFGGFYDELNGSEKAIFFDDTMILPLNSLVVMKMEAGNQLYRVIDLESNNDEFGHIYSKVIVTPVTKMTQHNEINTELNKEYTEKMLEKEADVDNSVQEFLNDLKDKNMATMEEFATQPEPEVKDVHKKAANDSVDFINYDDIL